jgi:hypothetical protein
LLLPIDGFGATSCTVLTRVLQLVLLLILLLLLLDPRG